MSPRIPSVSHTSGPVLEEVVVVVDVYVLVLELLELVLVLELLELVLGHFLVSPGGRWIG